ncbi:hypothetical protein C5167_044346 [Papaver somniferum]|uniref:DUF506 domain-containing protein n=1 Tax=Papaver somniferum TaxID=3469 RepID=A0A4Y7L8A0_PAPSO|nr:uncharacterized protein LOC113316510 [Papaver somniferum]RZC81764.1 hypothetical protein C5167_044346 [Papaver somniferum]
MGRNPGRFMRVAEAFNEGVKAARICAESSGSEHSAVGETSPNDLSDLVDSFLERGHHDNVQVDSQEHEKVVKVKKRKGSNDEDLDGFVNDSESKDMLKSLLSGFGDDSQVIKRIRVETEFAFKDIGMNSSAEDGFKRQLMTRLRQRGLDAGLCKSRWEKTGRFPAGTFEYIDVIISGNRYIVEVFLGGEFTIARPTDRYISLLEVFPQVFVGKPDKLKQVVRIMCGASKQSLKKNDMHIPPWRSNGYMQAKWLSLYKRTTNSVEDMVVSGSGTGKRSVGFETTPMTPVKFYYCRDELERRRDVGMGKEVGKLGQLFV